ncbi:hypothetical protein BABINDRAFT_91196 [Babjeviella inositovora NRRL Y-12698]|uniref:Uncharacterized protein n=1 Tax=Babjeviella inositovora NRRL Y-12698 TaxID=984486 RepID=A0A1E3QJY9_9ASCO|nr:uncharacterized protein BABINDRAFT_91196 [Babjeviella inositovora NRRL Y-12698]ODQ78001.1 hypothetical protein BABINDRAFT_91196 [Babjeviella inositovora NRRL Y-12698]
MTSVEIEFDIVSKTLKLVSYHKMVRRIALEASVSPYQITQVSYISIRSPGRSKLRRPIVIYPMQLPGEQSRSRLTNRESEL